MPPWQVNGKPRTNMDSEVATTTYKVVVVMEIGVPAPKDRRARPCGAGPFVEGARLALRLPGVAVCRRVGRMLRARLRRLKLVHSRLQRRRTLRVSVGFARRGRDRSFSLCARRALIIRCGKQWCDQQLPGQSSWSLCEQSRCLHCVAKG